MRPLATSLPSKETRDKQPANDWFEDLKKLYDKRGKNRQSKNNSKISCLCTRSVVPRRVGRVRFIYLGSSLKYICVN